MGHQELIDHLRESYAHRVEHIDISDGTPRDEAEQELLEHRVIRRAVIDAEREARDPDARPRRAERRGDAPPRAGSRPRGPPRGRLTARPVVALAAKSVARDRAPAGSQMSILDAEHTCSRRSPSPRATPTRCATRSRTPSSTASCASTPTPASPARPRRPPGLVLVFGEITTSQYVEFQNVVRDTVRDIGYTKAEYGFDYQTCGTIVSVKEQSHDIAQGVDQSGAGRRRPGDDVRVRLPRDAGAHAAADRARAPHGAPALPRSASRASCRTCGPMARPRSRSSTSTASRSACGRSSCRRSRTADTEEPDPRRRHRAGDPAGRSRRRSGQSTR